MGEGNGGVRAARNLSAAAVAAIAAWSSYSHMAHVALACGERPDVAYVLPFSVDGMLVVATIVMVDDKRQAGRVRPIAHLAFTAGVLASLAANIAAAYPSLGARAVDAWPALALLLVVEMLARPPAVPAEVPPEHLVVPADHFGYPSRATGPVPPQGEVPPTTQVPPQRPPASSQVPPGRRPLPASLDGTNRRWLDDQRPADPPSHPAPSQVANPRAEPHHPRPASGGTPTGSQVPLAADGPPDAEQPAGRRVVPAEQPPWGAGTAGTGRSQASAGRSRNSTAGGQGRARRPASVTRHLAQQILTAEPDLPRTTVAARLGVSPRRLRAVLAEPA